MPPQAIVTHPLVLHYGPGVLRSLPPLAQAHASMMLPAPLTVAQCPLLTMLPRAIELMMSILRVWQRSTCLHVMHGVYMLLLRALPILEHAEQFTGRVVGISDGDTSSGLCWQGHEDVGMVLIPTVSVFELALL